MGYLLFHPWNRLPYWLSPPLLLDRTRACLLTLECLGSGRDGEDRSTGVLLTTGYAWKDTLFPRYYNEITFGFEPLGPVSGDGNGFFFIESLGTF